MRCNVTRPKTTSSKTRCIGSVSLKPATHHISPFLPYPRLLTSNSPCYHKSATHDTSRIAPCCALHLLEAASGGSNRQHHVRVTRVRATSSHRFSALYEHYPSYHRRGIPMYVMIPWLNSHRTSKRPILDPADRSASPFPPRRPTSPLQGQRSKPS
jgi:hypothetical protein